MDIVLSVISFLIVFISSCWTFLTLIIWICLFLKQYTFKFLQHRSSFSLCWWKLHWNILSKCLLTVIILKLVFLDCLLIIFNDFLRLRMQEFLGYVFEEWNDFRILLKYNEFDCINAYQVISFALLIFLKVSYNFIIKILETMDTIIIDSKACLELDSHVQSQQSNKLLKIKSFSLMKWIIMSETQINLFR